MTFTLKLIRYFVAAAQQGSVSGASQSLSISQSAEAIKDLVTLVAVNLSSRRPEWDNLKLGSCSLTVPKR